MKLFPIVIIAAAMAVFPAAQTDAVDSKIKSYEMSISGMT